MAKAPTSPRLESWKFYVQLISLFAAAVWAIWYFYYSEYIKPTQGSKPVVIKTSIQKAGERERALALRVVVDIENAGERKVEISDIRYRLTGLKLFRLDESERLNDILNRTKSLDSAALNRRSSYFILQGQQTDDANVISEGRLLGEHSFLYPKERTSAAYIFHAPLGGYDAVKFEMSLVSHDMEIARSHGILRVDGKYYRLPMKGWPLASPDPAGSAAIVDNNQDLKTLSALVRSERTSQFEYFSLWGDDKASGGPIPSCEEPLRVAEAARRTSDPSASRLARAEQGRLFAQTHHLDFERRANATDRFPELLGLLLSSESIDDKEKINWYNLIPTLTEGQANRLNEILTTERDNLEKLSSDHEDEMRELVNRRVIYSKAMVCDWRPEGPRSTPIRNSPR